jgi:hypothetical protein
MLKKIRASLPNRLKETVDKLKTSMVSGKSIEEQIDDSMNHFGFDPNSVRIH